MIRTASLSERFLAFASGAMAILAIHVEQGWWLDAGSRVLTTGLVLAVAGFVLAAWHPDGRWGRATALWCGALAGSAGVLFWLGPGNLWPITLAFAAAIIGGAVMAGTLLAVAARRLRR